MERQYCASAYVVDFENMATLLMYNKKLDKWLQPGGHIEGFEIPSETCTREADEETGAKIQIIGVSICGVTQPISIGRYINKVGDMIDIQYAAVALCVSATNKENNKTGWFTVDQMLDMKVDPEIIEKVEYILTNYKKYISPDLERILNNNKKI